MRQKQSSISIEVDVRGQLIMLPRGVYRESCFNGADTSLILPNDKRYQLREIDYRIFMLIRIFYRAVFRRTVNDRNSLFI